MGMTMAYILYLHGRAPEEWEFVEIAKLLERRASEMRAVFQSIHGKTLNDLRQLKIGGTLNGKARTQGCL